MRVLLSFVGGFGFNLAYVWALPDARLWISLLIVASVAILIELLLVLAEEQLWSFARSVFHVSASIWRLLTDSQQTGQYNDLTSIACVAAAIVGWSVVTLVDEVANGDLVARIVLLSVGGVLLVVAVAPVCWERGEEVAERRNASKESGGAEYTHPHVTVPLPSSLVPGGKGKLSFVLDL